MVSISLFKLPLSSPLKYPVRAILLLKIWHWFCTSTMRSSIWVCFTELKIVWVHRNMGMMPNSTRQRVMGTFKLTTRFFSHGICSFFIL